MKAQSADYDVAILGSGVGGSILAAILARHGHRVVVIERGSHPRFAIGESTIPETTALFGILGARYGVPEIRNLQNYHGVLSKVSSACGIKRNFSFCYHRRGQSHQPGETSQFPTWAPPFGPDIHLFRQDVDAYLLAVSISYGATVKQQTGVQNLAIDERGVTLDTDSGERIGARFLIDCAGFSSPVSRALDLRVEPCPMQTRSRTIFTHMVNVMPYDQLVPPRACRVPSAFHQGTLHHLFDGGWLWVIPFDNGDDSTNRLCSVGLCLDIDRFPATGVEPEREFESIVGQYPDIARQLENARAVRNWTTTPRMQFQTRQMAGDRFLLLPHSAGFVDPLFSSGLAMTLSTINIFAQRLMDALGDDSFSHDRFKPVETSFYNALGYYDRLVACSYTSFRDFRLWNAWHRIWMIGSLYGVSGTHEVFARYCATGDEGCLAMFEQSPYRGTQAIDLLEYRSLFDAGAGVIEDVREGRRSVSESVDEIYRLIEESELAPPPWHLTDANQNCPGTFTLVPLIRLLFWGRYRSPSVVRAYYFRTGSLFKLLGAIGKYTMLGVGRFYRSNFRWVSSILFSGNNAWSRSKE